MSRTCYTTHGIILPDYGPCDPKASDTFCCTAGQTCLSNGLCATEIGTFYSGGCTDKTYKAAICPSFCTGGGSNFLAECKGAAVKDGDFCCSSNGDSTCCGTASNGLGLVAAQSSTTAAVANPSSSAATGSTSLGSSTSSVASSQITALSSESHSLLSASSLSSMQSTTTSASANAPSTHGNSPASGGIAPKDRLTIGLTVGLGVPVVLLCLLLGFVTYRHFQKRDGRRSKQPTGTEMDADIDKPNTPELPASDSPKELHSEHPATPEAHEIDSLTRTQRKWPEQGAGGMEAVEMDTDTEIRACKSDATPRTSLVPDENPLHPSPGIWRGVEKST